ncbi:4'-phosphopantetheinyl transferase sfp [compost metagenome]
MGLNLDEIHFNYNSYGKPLLNNHPNIGFNISHSGDWIAMIWGNDGEYLGIDVEEVKPMDLHFATNLFTPQENQLLSSKLGDVQLDYFFQLWTLKESYVKALGKGLTIPLNSFSVVYGDPEGWYSPEAIEFQFKSFRIDQSHILSACSKQGTLPDQIQQVSILELYDSLQ